MEGLIEDFGKCLTESHSSLANEYQLSCEKRDFIVNQSSVFPGVLGSKMISCSPIISTFHLVDKKATADFIKFIRNKYYEKYNSDLDIYISQSTSEKEKINQEEIESIV